LKSAPPRKNIGDARKPLVKLVEELLQKRDVGHIHNSKRWTVDFCAINQH
jgi:hypothetical protein